MSETSRQDSRLRNFAWYHLPAILFAVAILSVSSIPNLHGPELRVVPFDKLAHFLEYAFFSFLIFRSLSRLTWIERATTVFLLSLLILSLFAAGDEYFQRFVPGRQSDPADFAADVIGGILILTYLWLRKHRLGRV